MKRLLLAKDESTASELENSDAASSTETCLRKKDTKYQMTTLTTSSQVQMFITEKQERLSGGLSKSLKLQEKKPQVEETQMPCCELPEQKVNPCQAQQHNPSKTVPEKQEIKLDAQKMKHVEFQVGGGDLSIFFGKEKGKFRLQKFTVDRKLLEYQKELMIEQQKVYFPYEPYQVQVQYMSNVIRALNDKSHALLQSPTGTGKTLCLLSSVLSWVEQFYTKTHLKTKIIYMSRTHSQLKQVHKELEKTCYRPNMAIFASREQLCIKQELSQLKGREKIEACSRGVKLQRKLRKEEMNGTKKQTDPKILQAACQFYKEREEVLGIAKKKLTNVLLDIPKMKKIGLQEQFCPYFYPHHAKNTATLFLMPYNYLLDAYLLSSYSDLISDSIIIFDEAHNVPETACEGRSLTLQSINMQAAIVELNNILSNFASKTLMDIRVHYQKQIKFIIRNLQDYRQNFNRFGQQSLPLKNNLYRRQSWQREDIDSKIFNQQRTGQFIFQMFCGKIIKDQRKRQFQSRHDYYKQQMKSHLLNPIQEIVQYGQVIIQALKQTHDGFCANFEKFFIFANKIHQLLTPLIYQQREEHWLQTQINHFRLYVQRSVTNENHFSFGLRCLVPWLTFENIMKCNPRSIILTSGTLRPLQMWEKQLQIKFKYKLTNNHVIKREQISSRILCCGPSETAFTFTFDNMNRNKQAIYKDLIETLIQICSFVPNGILLVFPSFRMQSQFRIQFSRSPKKHRFNEFKHIIFEEKNSDTNMQDFKQKALSDKGAVLALICRGKLSEGIDFPDGMCRAVIMIGIPYPNVKDPFIIQKKNHLDNIASRSVKKSEAIRGEQWYFMGTIRSINQALGRVIRHAFDYGMIFLVDRRYKESKFNKQLPRWITQSIEAVETPNHNLYRQISSFYQEMNAKYKPMSKVQREAQIQQKTVNEIPQGQKRETENKNGFGILMNNRHKFQRKRRRRSYTNDFI